MLSFAAPDTTLPVAVDSFERTSNRDLQDFDSRFREIVHSSNRQSQFLTMYDVFKRQASLLNELGSVPDDWNGYGSPAPSTDAIRIARTILSTLWTERLLPRQVCSHLPRAVLRSYFHRQMRIAPLSKLLTATKHLSLFMIEAAIRGHLTGPSRLRSNTSVFGA